ncbi:MAG TPA: nuclear transport factor 2 family protein [Kutzneria sp.]|jgi:ketosteroid isomerase-like protein
MSPRDVITRYYELANRGDWDAWTDLFTPDLVMDEQLAGHIEGQDALRSIMREFPAMYSSFANRPKHILVDGDQAAVVSRIEATTSAGETIEADVVNYFRLDGDHIAYLANFHDTVPFQALAG